MSRDADIWNFDLRADIKRKIEAAKKAGRGVQVSPYWLSRILGRLEEHEPPEPWQKDVRLVK